MNTILHNLPTHLTYLFPTTPLTQPPHNSSNDRANKGKHIRRFSHGGITPGMIDDNGGVVDGDVEKHDDGEGRNADSGNGLSTYPHPS